MASQFSVERLLEEYTNTLALSWVVRPQARERERGAEASVGYMNLIRPNAVQVLGSAEIRHIDALAPGPLDELSRGLFAPSTLCVVIADGLRAREALVDAARRARVPLIGAGADSLTVVKALRDDVAEHAARRACAHGVFLEILGIGVLLAGAPGIGKSELALELLSRGHRLIADDSPEFRRVNANTIEGMCPQAIRDFMEVRGLGIVNVRALFGDTAVKPRRSLRLVIRLEVMDEQTLTATQRLQGVRHTHEILDVPIPAVTLPVAPGHNLAVLVECTVRNHLSRINGYDAAKDFTEKQERMIERDRSTEGVS